MKRNHIKIILLVTFVFIQATNVSDTTNDYCNVLALQSGGSYGAIELGVLSKLREISPKNQELLTGVSAGSINAGYLSQFKSNFDEGVKQASDISKNLTNSDVYKVDILKNTHSVFDTSPLRATLTKQIGAIKDKTDRITAWIGSTNLNSGNLEIFSTEEQNDDADSIEIVMCSSAIPIVFPYQQFKGNTQVDGGVLQSEILSGMASFCKPEQQIWIDQVVADQNSQADYVKSFANELAVFDRIYRISSKNTTDQIAKIKNSCQPGSKIRGKVNIHQFTGKTNVFMLDFNQGEKLWNLGQNTYAQQLFDYCP